MLGAELVRRALEEGGVHRDVPGVGVLGSLGEATDLHILDHSLTQRSHGHLSSMVMC
jgi:hypothetical protein